MKYAINTEVTYDNAPATVLGYAKGWYTVLDEQDEKHKARAAELTPVNERTMCGQLKKARAGYQRVKNYAGESSLDCGDSTAQLLRGLEPHETMVLADKLYAEEVGYHSTRWSHLNAGQQRMCAGNRIRTGLKKEAFTPDNLSSAYKELDLSARGQE